ncbi:helix-turn-helix transcriptional regulator [Geobacter pickeringii]|uniref:helix-turn-helix transcriptional regulator n=1 Tax=Geobacter pickeringii TaxID=345632 RepID=UPI000B3088A1|nr:helix-turn-helix transcriptional regulator [Geobacter pickeringii]
METTAEKNDKAGAPIVAIDGSTIKRIREAKKLTQLYVASVVGVTTDTISRWENNRYPTIKRDNAEKLATALEVAVEEILRREPSAEELPAEPPPPPVTSRKRWWWGALLLAVAVAVAGVFLFQRSTPPLPPGGFSPLSAPRGWWCRYR